ncbi:amino acid ABC transporter permease [Bosea caraganae]|uniref:Amino acid ABC transporter permease n=1 Tax=Bosea caraganae TaxID=2763117 RepID=A0A370L8M7_9HYPH|nr:amino acid ABC transporter permease [Bosea caraganae]RDJ26740.1 amino acid ABC transporter permease [Bosea caraganae]RDJ30627.1 amino acid ABC transporter permease [Bosea caraganae]
MQRTLTILYEFRDTLLYGLGVTVSLSVLSMLAALVVGLIAALGMLSRRRWLSMPATFYVEFCRNTPILVQLVWVHYAWPEIFGLKFTAFYSSLVALTLQTSGYLAEEYRGGIEAVDKGQVEAAKSLGMTHSRLMARIVLPQAIMRSVPGLLNQFVTCFKSTSIVSVIAVPDLMYQAGLIVSATFLTMPIYTIVAIIYFVVVFAISRSVRWLTRKLPTTGYFGAAA